MFQLVLLIHILSGTVCLFAGLVAGFARKRKGVHTIAGEVYHASYVFVFITCVVMAVWHWETSAYLFYIGIFSYGLALVGYIATKRKKKGWLKLHISFILGSYIAILTAVLVVNAHRIPIINEIPVLLVWFLPTIIGSPIIALIGRKYIPKKKK